MDNRLVERHIGERLAGEGLQGDLHDPSAVGHASITAGRGARLDVESQDNRPGRQLAHKRRKVITI